MNEKQKERKKLNGTGDDERKANGKEDNADVKKGRKKEK